MSNERDWDRFFKLVDEFMEKFEANSAAMENPALLRGLKFQLSEISSYDHYIAEKASEIASLLDIFFSARKHKKYPGGASAVYSRIVHDLLGRIRQRAKIVRAELAGDNGVTK